MNKKLFKSGLKNASVDRLSQDSSYIPGRKIDGLMVPSEGGESLEEFTQAIRRMLADCLKLATDDDISGYMAEAETKELILEKYGEYADRGFVKLDYHVATTVYNLYMLF